MHLVFVSKEAKYFFRKNCVDFNYISLIHSYVYIHIALCYQELYLQDTCNDGNTTFCIVKITISYLSIDC